MMRENEQTRQTSERTIPDAMNDQNSTRDVKSKYKNQNRYEKRQQSG